MTTIITVLFTVYVVGFLASALRFFFVDVPEMLPDGHMRDKLITVAVLSLLWPILLVTGIFVHFRDRDLTRHE